MKDKMETSQLTLESLPMVVSQLNEKIDRLLALQNQSTDDRDRFFNLTQFINYLPEQPARATVYGWVARRLVPFHKEGKKLLFRKSEIDLWLENGRSMKGLL